MEDRFKFRVWSKHSGSFRMSLPFELEQLVDNDRFCRDEVKDSTIWMQSTGLKDKNGVLIFEGDILDNCQFDLKGVMEWKDDGISQAGWSRFFPMYQFEIVGNIHQDSHLLKGEENVQD